MADKEVLKEELLVKNALFKSLHNEHRAHEGRLQELSQKSLLSQSDELEEKRIKVHKLQLKDRMESILSEYQDSRISA